MSKTKTFSIQSILRHYSYVCRVDADTGKLINIQAGCRNWTSFAKANRHYDGTHKRALGVTWQDDTRAHLNGHAADDSTIYYYRREEARTILRRLQVLVSDYTHRLERKRLNEEAKASTAAKLAKKPVKKIAKKAAKKKTR